jgi:Na+/H+ antiporter NhaD/arsenite permease-like protein
VITALIIFIITYVFIGLRQIPRVHVDRPAGALVGAVLMISFGVLTLDQAFAAIDMHTLLLLLGMMIITVYLRAAGFFELMADKILLLSKTPLQLLIFVALSSGLLSALFVNDTLCLLYTPIILEVTLQLGRNPMPYLLALATSSNIGSVMTVTGNPQNMLIGIYSKIPYLSFLGVLFPVALAGLAVSVLVIWLVYKKEMKSDAFSSRPVTPEYRVRKTLLVKALLVCAAVLVSFSLGYPYSLVAAAGAVALLLIGGVSTERILEGVDWTLLLFFSGLFVVMHGVEASGLAAAVIERTGDLASLPPLGRIAGLSVVSLILSNLVSNVPAVMLLKPLVQSLADSHPGRKPDPHRFSGKSDRCTAGQEKRGNRVHGIFPRRVDDHDHYPGNRNSGPRSGGRCSDWYKGQGREQSERTGNGDDPACRNGIDTENIPGGPALRHGFKTDKRIAGFSGAETR